MPAGGLWKLLQAAHPGLFHPTLLPRLPARKVLLDAANLAEKALRATRFLPGGRAFVRQPRTTDGLRCAFLRPLLSLAVELRKGDTEPALVIDSEPWLQRQSLRDDALPPARRGRGGLRKEELELAQHFFALCGLEVIACSGNGDRVLAHLSRTRRAPVLSENGELLGLGVFGLGRSVSLGKGACLVRTSEALRALKLPGEALPALHALLGTPHNSRLPRVSARRLIELLREGLTLEQIAVRYDAPAPLLAALHRTETYCSNRERPVYTRSRPSAPDTVALEAFLANTLRPGKLRAALTARLPLLAPRGL